ncbi:hypothetical protein [Phyllobacterium sp. OV277]|uniref:hypothetical protein n=1 Tax=Phyllobacterium sp. OV277 TaxID=1882772 RepID=UPI0008837A9C|nr:hypothetical protein [Phyllobacterium sp. OV277]SDP09466.1 hypothetical protein SAMN05443582_103384 [Phyllobacterium sp. OV277]
MITDADIDAVYDVIETLALAILALDQGDIADNTASSISWLMGSMQKRLAKTLDILEQAKGGQPVDNGD